MEGYVLSLSGGRVQVLEEVGGGDMGDSADEDVISLRYGSYMRMAQQGIPLWKVLMGRRSFCQG